MARVRLIPQRLTRLQLCDPTDRLLDGALLVSMGHQQRISKIFQFVTVHPGDQSPAPFQVQFSG